MKISCLTLTPFEIEASYIQLDSALLRPVISMRIVIEIETGKIKYKSDNLKIGKNLISSYEEDCKISFLSKDMVVVGRDQCLDSSVIFEMLEKAYHYNGFYIVITKDLYINNWSAVSIEGFTQATPPYLDVS